MAIPVFLQNSGVAQFDPSLGSDWDVAFIDNVQVPGVVKCVPKTSRKVDVANAPGQAAATMRFQGIDPGAFSLTITVWTPQQQADLETMLIKVAPAAGRTTYANGKYTTTGTAGDKRPASFTFYHPAAAAAGIGTIIVESLTWYEAGPAPQSKQVVLECKQALPPKRVFTGIVTVSAPNKGGVGNATPPSAGNTAKGP